MPAVNFSKEELAEYFEAIKNTANNPLYDACRKFIKDNKITCPETIYQMDHVIENAFDFIQKICDIVGYEKETD